MRHHPTAPPDAEPLPAGDLPLTVSRFLTHLRHVPLGAWAEAARSIEDGTPGAPHTGGTLVRAQLRQLMNEMPHSAALARRRVLDVVGAAQGFLHPAETARMKKVALAAAMALVVRPALGEERFAQVYAPFARLIPLSKLATGAEGTAGSAWGSGAALEA